MNEIDPKRLVRALIKSSALRHSEPTRITHCVDCGRAISKARRWRSDCQRCGRCHRSYVRKQAKREFKYA
ncbi:MULTISPECIES: hypothetical protein [unclassified Pasteurella]|uniref:hypothetical protein n=1 Tax=unclassified Pasteurella TaxID=2621516 RepID=UPI0010733771|nr:hypothetical protein [Pasteurella sp. 19428wF3_WM03]TFU50459.1 hypothetical protein E4T92_08800 [Pasteurella sp. WM03]